MLNPVTATSVLRSLVLSFLTLMSTLMLLTESASAADAVAPDIEDEMAEIQTAPVRVDGVTLMQVRGISSYPAEKRADVISGRIKDLAADLQFSPGALRIEEAQGSSRIMAGKQMVLTVTEADARLEGIDRSILASAFVTQIGEVISNYRKDREMKPLVRSALIAVVSLVLLAGLLWLGNRAMVALDVWLDRRIKSKLDGLEAKSLRLLNATQLWRILRGLRRFLWTAFVLISIVFFINFVLGLFPWTRDFAEQMFALLFDPLRALGYGLLGAIPDLIILTIIVFAARYLLKSIQLFFMGIERGTVLLAGLSSDVAMPTYRLVRVLVIAFTLVVAYPYIPGSGSEAFKGVSLFLGVIFSLGSSSVISNVIAGYTMVYRRAFFVGDRVRINEHMGDVTETRLLVTHLRTPKNEEIVIPNSVILNSSVMNYSLLARQGKLILHTPVGIGYETPWRQVEAMLLLAADRTEGFLKDPKPFVLQTALGDFAVTYEINVYCNNAQAMAELYTRLYRNILDVFNEYNVQIMTPSYVQDTPEPKVVPKEQWYTAPAVAPR